MADAYETFVRWYLRFNGYLGAENYVLHEPSAGRVPQGGEFDVLAVRFPYSKEVAGFSIENDTKLMDSEACQKRLVDFVIAEVKSGRSASLNAVWKQPDPAREKRKKLARLVAWLGPFPDNAVIDRVASELQQDQRSVSNGYLFRLVVFAQKPRGRNVPTHVRQITFKEIAEFFVKVRTPCWQDRGLGVRSAHDQWDPLIKKAWKIGDPSNLDSGDKKVDDILNLLEA